MKLLASFKGSLITALVQTYPETKFDESKFTFTKSMTFSSLPLPALPSSSFQTNINTRELLGRQEHAKRVHDQLR